MRRVALDYLRTWRTKPTRKPLVVRGARQVGKSFLIRAFGAEFANLVEINLETSPELRRVLAGRDVRAVIRLLETTLDVPIRPGETLLFLDELQAAPEVIPNLRYLHEELPELHVIAAGSLLEFVLSDHAFSMPVGRIEYLHLGPMTFEEFLLAAGRERQVEFIQSYEPGAPVPEALHTELMKMLRTFLITGGLPGAVKAYLEAGSWRLCDEIKQGLLSTYRDDFGKYGLRVNRQRLEKVFQRIPALVGGKLVYTRLDREERSRDLRQAVESLRLARLLHLVPHSDCSGVPLGAEASDRDVKPLFLDVGLLCRACGLGAADIERAEDVVMVNAGAVAEQFVGQHLVYSGEFYEEPQLYCWMRQSPVSNAEVDYVMSVGLARVPVEVKSGKTGTLRSLHVMMIEKGLDLAIRLHGGLPADQMVDAVIPRMVGRKYRLVSLPLYMVGQVRRLCRR